MDYFYHLNLAALVGINAALLYRQQIAERSPSTRAKVDNDHEKPPATAGSQSVSEFKRNYFLVYILVVASDWLQVSGRTIYQSLKIRPC